MPKYRYTKQPHPQFKGKVLPPTSAKDMPKCDLCPHELGQYDTPTARGPWGNLGPSCWYRFGIINSTISFFRPLET